MHDTLLTISSTFRRVANGTSDSGSGSGTGSGRQGSLFVPTDCEACRVEPSGQEVAYVRFQLETLRSQPK